MTTQQANGGTPVRDHVLVLFGASGDLARRKLWPGVFHLHQEGRLPAGFRVLAVSRSARSDDDVRDHARSAVEEFGRGGTTGWEEFAGTVRAARSGPDGDLAQALDAARGELDDPAVLFYLSVPPDAMGATLTELADGDLSRGAKVVLEKPFGHDVASARELQATLEKAFAPGDVFRIDHFVGKEAVQNLLAMRFANGLLEPAWNRTSVCEVQIDVPEKLSIEGRADFYEETGALRDMVVTHLFQVLGFVAMEPPRTLGAEDLHAARRAVFDALRPLDPADVVRGQYAGYTGADGVPADSTTETFVALRAFVDNDRWQGVPFHLRTGKSMPEGRRLVTLVLRAPGGTFEEIGRDDVEGDCLLFDLGDPGSVEFRLLAKTPGDALDVAPTGMQMRLRGRGLLEAYERLLLDALRGDQTLFTDAAAVERLWQVAEPVLRDAGVPEPYEPGTWGPRRAQEMTYWRLRS